LMRKFDLGLRFLKGDGVQDDPAEAASWLKAAAATGDQRAVQMLKELSPR